MLKHELEHRAELIWGSSGIRKVSVRADGGVDVEVERGKIREHRLNFIGRAACHKQCQKYDEFLARGN
jgi:hypothetical protein